MCKDIDNGDNVLVELICHVPIHSYIPVHESSQCIILCFPFVFVTSMHGGQHELQIGLFKDALLSAVQDINIKIMSHNMLSIVTNCGRLE